MNDILYVVKSNKTDKLMLAFIFQIHYDLFDFAGQHQGFASGQSTVWMILAESSGGRRMTVFRGNNFLPQNCLACCKTLS